MSYRRGCLNNLSPKRCILLTTVIAILTFGLGLLIGFTVPTGSSSSEPSTRPQFSADEVADMLINNIQPKRIRSYLKEITSKPHLGGEVGNNDLAHRIADLWKELGFKTYLQKYNVLLSFPDREKPSTISLYDSNGTLLHRTAEKEKILAGGYNDSDVVPPYNAYSPPGTPRSNRIVYVNYGTVDDFARLRNMSINLTDAIAIARYGKIFRADKLRLADKAGCKGLILYSDPSEKYRPENNEEPYPDSWWMPETGVERGTVYLNEGDPLTPSWPSIDSAYRLAEEDANLPKIPCHPISYGDAEEILKHMGGDVAPPEWQGNLNITYKLGPSFKDPDWVVQMNISTFNRRNDSYNVVAIIPGEVEPDRYVLLGNHRDAWVFGALDPSSGTACLMELSSAIAELQQQGWKPRRTIILLSWGSEEYGLIGSYEWVEQYAKSLGDRAIAYLNVDIAMEGNSTLQASATPILRRVLFEAARKIPNPNPDEIDKNRKTVFDTWRLHHPDSSNSDLPSVGGLGAGSDYAGFLQLTGVSSIDFRYTFNETRYDIPIYPMYHSAYETFHLVDEIMDTTFEYHTAVARMWGEVMRALCDTPILPVSVSDYGVAIISHVVALNDSYHDRMVNNGLAHDLDYLFQAGDRLMKATVSFDEKLRGADTKNDMLVRSLNDQVMQLERSFINPFGLPNKPQYKHVIYAPSTHNSYGTDSFPALTDALFGIDQCTINCRQRWNYVSELMSQLSFMIQSAASSLDEVTTLEDAAKV